MASLFRRWLTRLAFCLLVGITLASAAQIALVTPSQASGPSHEELVEWLSATSAAEQPRSVQRRMARRMEYDFRRQHDWQAEFDRLEPPQRATMADNFYYLLGMLLAQRVETFLALPESEHDAWLDEQINQILQWRLPNPDGQASQGAFNLRPASVQALAEHVARASDGSVTPAELQQFANALLTRWMARDLQKFFRRHPR